jgi:hypothetical protein
VAPSSQRWGLVGLPPKERKDRPDPNVAELARAKRRAERAETKLAHARKPPQLNPLRDVSLLRFMV